MRRFDVRQDPSRFVLVPPGRHGFSGGQGDFDDGMSDDGKVESLAAAPKLGGLLVQSGKRGHGLRLLKSTGALERFPDVVCLSVLRCFIRRLPFSLPPKKGPDPLRLWRTLCLWLARSHDSRNVAKRNAGNPQGWRYLLLAF